MWYLLKVCLGENHYTSSIISQKNDVLLKSNKSVVNNIFVKMNNKRFSLTKALTKVVNLMIRACSHSACNPLLLKYTAVPMWILIFSRRSYKGEIFLNEILSVMLAFTISSMFPGLDGSLSETANWVQSKKYPPMWCWQVKSPPCHLIWTSLQVRSEPALFLDFLDSWGRTGESWGWELKTVWLIYMNASQ